MGNYQFKKKKKVVVVVTTEFHIHLEGVVSCVIISMKLINSFESQCHLATKYLEDKGQIPYLCSSLKWVWLVFDLVI